MNTASLTKLYEKFGSSDLHHINDAQFDMLMYALKENGPAELGLTSADFDYLIKGSNLLNKNKQNLNAFMVAMANQKQNALTREQFDYLIENSDLKLRHAFCSSLFYAFGANVLCNLHFSVKQFEFLVRNSDLHAALPTGKNALMMALNFNKSRELNLTTEVFDCLIENSRLSDEEGRRTSALVFFLHFYREEGLRDVVSEKSIQALYERCSFNVKNFNMRETENIMRSVDDVYDRYGIRPRRAIERNESFIAAVRKAWKEST